MDDPRSFRTFAEFYPFYLREHGDRRNRRLHFAGSTGVLLCVGAAVAWREPWWLLAALVCGYGLAWFGHFVFEKNRPASFRRPVYSFFGDWVMYRDLWTGRLEL